MSVRSISASAASWPVADSTHGVEILEGREIRPLQVVEVQARDHQGFLNATSGEAGRVLLDEAHGWLPGLAM